MQKAIFAFLAFATAACGNGGSHDGGGNDAIVNDALASATLTITTSSDTPQSVAPGAAFRLAVVILNGDGTTSPLPTGTNVTWTAPETVIAADPLDGGSAALPTDNPLAFFINNPFRPDRSDYDGTLFIVQRGTTDAPNVTVTASVSGYGQVTAYVPVRDPLIGDPDAGATAWVAMKCADCHGATGAGSPPDTDGGSTYTMQGGSYPYPAPALNAGDGGAATDPAWNGAYYGLAAQGSIDNRGVALRKPMPDQLGAPTAQDFADIYAFMRTQTQ
jgi:hypothetical protein